MKYRLSDAANRLQGQPMFKILALAKDLEKQGKDIIHLEIGDPDFSSPEEIIEAAYSSMKSGEVHYENSLGNREFRETIAQTTLRSRKFMPNLGQTIVTPGANIAIYYAISCLVNPGDEVIVPDPGFPTYYAAINYCNVKAVPVPLYEKNKFRMQPSDVEAAITDKTRIIIVNSPNNPTGAVMTRNELEGMARLAEKYDIYLLTDEIYSRMIYGEDDFYSPAMYDACLKRTILINGFSKAFAMTGWRLGAVVGPTDVIDKMGLLLQTTSSCVPTFIQKAGQYVLEHDLESVRNMMTAYRDRISFMVDSLNGLPGISCIKPEGAFYLFANITKTGMTSHEFATYTLEKAGIALLPGNNFGRNGEGFVRICCAISIERLKESIVRLSNALEISK
jgi:aspartate aminotransferase